MLRVFEAFAGIGTQHLALNRLGIPFEVVGISEIDRQAIAGYQAIHGPVQNFGDITQINPSQLPDFDLFTYSFPCQDLSQGGKQSGLIKGQTRSGLLYECEKVIEAKRPKYLLLENVKHLISKKFKPSFDEWLAYLERLGYTNYWQVLNAKDYGIPQSRARVFVVSILGEHQPYSFPQPQVTPTLSTFLNLNSFNPHQPIDVSTEIKPSSRAHFIREAQQIVAHPQGVYRCDCTSGWQDHKVGITYVPTLRANNSQTCLLDGNLIRRITPLEAFLLMGMSVDDYEKASTVLSKAALYKVAGNAIVVDVLEQIFEALFCPTTVHFKQTKKRD